MELDFLPPRRPGLIFHLAFLLASLTGSVWLFYQATESRVGSLFWGYLGGCALLALAGLVLFYRLYGLLRGRYHISTGRIRLVWGLREILIPMVDINWIQREDELETPVPLPVLRWPGSVTGSRRFDRRRRVEFLASRPQNLVVIETSRRAYAISPENPDAFVEAFIRLTEIGDLEPVAGSSVDAGRLIRNAWQDRTARFTLAGAFLAAAGFLAWILFGVNPAPGVSHALANTGRQVTSAQLFLLPVLNGGYFILDLLLGLFFFRRPETQPLAYLLWIASLFSSFLLALGVLLLLR